MTEREILEEQIEQNQRAIAEFRAAAEAEWDEESQKKDEIIDNTEDLEEKVDELGEKLDELDNKVTELMMRLS